MPFNAAVTMAEAEFANSMQTSYCNTIKAGSNMTVTVYCSLVPGVHAGDEGGAGDVLKTLTL